MSTAAVSALKRQLADALLARTEPYCVTLAAKFLEIDVARLSDLRHGRIEQFSLEWLIDRLGDAQCGVSMTTHPRTEPTRWARFAKPRPVNTPLRWMPGRKP